MTGSASQEAQTLRSAERTTSSVHGCQLQEWALDLAHDAVAAGRTIRVLSVVDVYTRECSALEVDDELRQSAQTRVLDEIIHHRGEPRSIRCDNGLELTSRHFLAWCIENKIELVHIQPGKPTQNAHVEKLSRAAARRVPEDQLVSKPVWCQKEDRYLVTITTSNGHTAA